MMAQQQTEQADFHALLEKQYRLISPEDALSKLRSKAWDHYLQLGLPGRKSEVFGYIRLKNLFGQSFVPAEEPNVEASEIETYLLPECKESVLVFVNGRFRPSLSRTTGISAKAVILPLNHALRTYSAFLNNQWSKLTKEESDPFAALNAAMHEEGAFVYLPPKTLVDNPVQILNLVKLANGPALLTPRLHVFAGAQAEITLAMTVTTLSGAAYCINQVTDVSIEEAAHVRIVQCAVDEPENSWHFDALRGTLKRNSTLTTFAATDGSSTVRQDYRVQLTGENAEALLNGIWMLKGKREAHTHVLIDHQAPNCRSFQLYKGALTDTSRSSFEGKILVRQAAQKTEAFQLNNNLILNEGASADSKPNLEIFADDVKASHGATVGQLDKEELFYLKTRGFSDAAAKNLLVYGFCKEVINKIPLRSLQGLLSEYAQNVLNIHKEG